MTNKEKYEEKIATAEEIQRRFATMVISGLFLTIIGILITIL